jgi:hypothetical protein
MRRGTRARPDAGPSSWSAGEAHRSACCSALHGGAVGAPACRAAAIAALRNAAQRREKTRLGLQRAAASRRLCVRHAGSRLGRTSVRRPRRRTAAAFARRPSWKTRKVPAAPQPRLLSPQEHVRLSRLRQGGTHRGLAGNLGQGCLGFTSSQHLQRGSKVGVASLSTASSRPRRFFSLRRSASSCRRLVRSSSERPPIAARWPKLCQSGPECRPLLPASQASLRQSRAGLAGAAGRQGSGERLVSCTRRLSGQTTSPALRCSLLLLRCALLAARWHVAAAGTAAADRQQRRSQSRGRAAWPRRGVGGPRCGDRCVCRDIHAAREAFTAGQSTAVLAPARASRFALPLLRSWPRCPAELAAIGHALEAIRQRRINLRSRW